MRKHCIAVIGSGYWGKNLVRNFHELGVLNCVCDTRSDVLDAAHNHYDAKTTADLDTVLADQSTCAVAVAVPAAQHYDVVKRCLLDEKDVFVEKPLALHTGEGEELVDLATRKQRILMVGHILEYHPAIIELKRLIQSGELGKIQYIYSSRLNLGKLRTEENILWSFAPHDISAILYLLDESPVRVTANGGSYVNATVADTTLTTCEFASHVKAHFFVSWLHPFKEQKLTIVGSKRMAVFDDVQTDRKLVLYSHTIEWLDRIPVAHRDEGQIVPLPNVEPLRAECEHFLHCIATRNPPRTNGHSAVRVLRVLQACEESLNAGGELREIISSKRTYSAHPTAVIDPGAQVGCGTKIWHFSHVMSGSKIGANCNFGQNVVISPAVTIGNNVKIQNNVSVYTGVVLEDDVFCGPSMVFTNVVNPRSHVLRKHEYRETLVRQGASIGANATVVCGVTLGRYSFVGAGAVVTRDVPDYALVLGVPAKQVGWICYCGVRLPESGSISVCRECGRTYAISNGRCRELVADNKSTKIIGQPIAA